MITKQQVAQAISILFHPLIIPTLGFLLLMNSEFYFALLTFDAKKFILLVIFLSTFLLPLITLWLMILNSRMKLDLNKSTDRVLPLLATAVYYYLGYYFLGRIPVYPVYRIFMISSILIIVILILISLRWKISAHMAGIGGLIGAVIALSLRLGINTSVTLGMLIIIAGLVGTARLVLGKHNPLQIYAGFFLGFLVNYLILVLI